MSWEEYKKKREQESSWAKYKQQRDYEIKQKELVQKEQNKLLEKLNLPTKEVKNNQTVTVPNVNSKNNNMTNVRNSMTTSLSQQLAQATTTKDKGIVTSVSDIMNRIKADEKNKNISKGGVEAFNEYMDSTLNAIPGGTMTVFSGIANAGTSLAGAGIKGLQNLTNNENVEERLQETYDKIINIGKSIHEKGNSTNLVNRYIDNNFTRESSNLVHTVSSQLATYGLSLATGIPAPVIQGTYVGGSSAQEVLNENKDNVGKAVLTGVGKGLTSYGVEKLTGGNILGKGSFDDMAVGLIANNFSSKTGQKIASKIYEVGGEVFEENLENAIDMVIDNVVNQKGYTVKDWWNELGETSKGTILATIALNLLGLGGDTYNRVQDYKLDSQAKRMIKEAEMLIEKENLKIDFDKMKQENIQNTISEQTKTLANNQEMNYTNVESESGKNGYNPNEQGTIEGIYQQENSGKQREGRNTVDGRTENSIMESQNSNDAKTLYEEYEKQARENQITNITNNQQLVKQFAKNKYGKDIIYYDDNNTKLSGGLSKTDNISVFFGKNTVNDFGETFLLGHEIGEDMLKHHKDKVGETYETLKEKIQNDDNFGDIFLEYIFDMDENLKNIYIEHPEAVAKELICDTLGFMQNNNELGNNLPHKDIGNIWIDKLDKNLLNEMKSILKSHHDEIYSSNNNSLPTKETPNMPTSTNTSNIQATKEISENLPIKETNVEKYSRYKKNILDSRAKEVNNLISYKNETTRNIEKKILEKETLLNSKKDKNTKTASVLRAQIENLKTRQQRIENLYNEKIDKVNAKTNRDKINFETRNTIKKEARENLKAEISPLTEDLTKYKDKKAGILYNRETAQRNIDDIVSDKELAQAIKETIFDPIQVHQAQKTKEINRLFDKINSLNLDKTKKYDYTVETSTISGEITEAKKHIKIDEATLAQLLIENKITNQKLKNDYNMSNEQIEKINKTANTFTEILDDLYNKMNEEQIKYGYSPIGKLNNYFPHFFENKPDTMLGKIASYFGIDITKQDLPTEIAGKTDIFKPGKTWNSNTLQRKTNRTDYDALKAMEKYIQGATDIIYTTEDIQKVREFERQIRYQYSDKGIQESIDDILNNSELTQEAKDSAIDGVFKNSENELSNFVTWLNDYGNTLANKKSFADRNMERNIGRNLYSSMSGIEARIASNTIGGNLSVSLTNFAPLFQAAGTTKVHYLLTGMLQTTSNNIKGIIGNKDISFVDNSNFLTNRFGTDTIADRTVTQKISDVASIPMNIIDEFTAESIVRGKYLENIDKGMTEELALDNADKYASKLMADRSKGSLPIIFNAKNPISKLTTMFQVEPNNIISNYLKDMPREATNKAELTKQATKLIVASYAFNTLVMAIRGGNEVLPDPVRWVSYLIKAITGDDDEKEKARTDLMESVIGSIPFASNVAGLFGFEDIGRVPISNAMPNLANIAKAFDSEADSKYRKETALKELLKPFIYLGFPTGGAQIKKTFEGISTVLSGGSYKTDKEGNKILQFPVENPSATDYIRAGILGKYSLPMAKEYQDRNFKSLSAKQTKTYEESNLPFKEYLEYIDQKLKTNEDKINYLSEQDWNENQKWGIYTNDIFSSTERKKDGGSQLSDAKYITSNGVSKSEYIRIYDKAQKNNIDMPTAKEYKEMKANNVTLKNYIEYKVKVKELTESKRKSKELSNTENLKNADKIQILLDSNYSNKEISAIYANYIKSEKDTEYDIMKATGIDIKEYLKYKQQEFESDKEDDGTLAGKTVSKSKQKKVVEYLNSNIKNGNQRLLLYAMQGYTTTSSQKTQLANYVKALKIDKNTKLKLYDKFSGFTVYKDGTVKW